MRVSSCHDNDGDGHYAISADCPQGDDCNDNDPKIYPRAFEKCDNKDNDCDGETDEGLSTDADGDGHYAISANCSEGDDCDDSDPTIYPSAEELCDSKDNDCDGEVDENCECNLTNTGSSTSISTGNYRHTQEILGNIILIYDSYRTSEGPIGRGWTHSYTTRIEIDTDDSLEFTENGNAINFRLSAGVYKAEPRSGISAEIVINPNGTFTLNKKIGLVYQFATDGRLLSVIDRNGNQSILTYTNNLLTSVTDFQGRNTLFTYDSSNRIIQVTDPAGRNTAFSYNPAGFLTSVTSSDGSTWSYNYDASGRMVSKTDPLGSTTSYMYDSEGRMIQATDVEGNIKTISYDQANKTSTVTEWAGGTWTYKYDNYFNVQTEITDPNGAIKQRVYDSNKNLLSETDELGNTTTYTYDSEGNMISMTDSLGHTTTYTYNRYGQTTSITDSEGNTVLYTYDANGNLTSTTDPTGATIQYWYDLRGNITSITNAIGQTTTFTYDQYNNLTSITEPTGATTTFTYDVLGNMTSQTDPQGDTTRYEYDSIGRLIRVIGPPGTVTEYTYDSLGRKTSMQDANGNTTYYEYNHRGQLIKVIDALGNITQYTYGGGGCSGCGGGGDKLTSITDAKGNVTTYQYNFLGRLTGESDSLGDTITYIYDAKGNLTSKTDANGDTILYTYDSLNRLIQKTYPDGTFKMFTYDPKGNILTASNQNISYTFTYDANGRIIAVTDSNGRVIQYSYDPSGNRTQLIYSDGSIVNYTYDNANRLSSIINGGGRTTTYSYESTGRRVKMTYPNGTITTNAYDNTGHLTSLLTQNSELQNLNYFTYTHDNVGNRLTETETGTKYTYSYDKIYRLLQSIPTKLQGKDVEQENKAETFSYDPVGNRLTGPETIDYYYYNQGNQLTDDRKSQYEYDKNGNLVSKTEIGDDGSVKTWTYFYDYENRLVKVIKQEPNETKTVIFKHDPFGKRIGKKVEGNDGIKVYTYVYDNEDIIIEYLTKTENGETKTEVTKYVHGLSIDEPISIERNGEIYYYHADGLGSIIALTDSKQKIVEGYSYTSFGEIKRQGNHINNTYTFTGREWDEEIGLYYYRARYYDAKGGRFISFDSILHPANGPSRCGQAQTISIPSFISLLKRPQNLNPYVYTVANPINLTDPTGLACGSGWTDKIVPDHYGSFDFTPACTEHDKCYETCGESKLVCDALFLNDMLYECRKLTWYPISQFSCIEMATVYYAAVFSAGLPSYWKAQRKACCK